MSSPVSWRPSEAARAALERLEAKTGKKRAQLLDALIIAADRGPAIVADNDRGSAAVAKQRLSVDPAKIAAFQEKTGMTHFGKKR